MVFLRRERSSPRECSVSLGSPRMSLASARGAPNDPHVHGRALRLQHRRAVGRSPGGASCTSQPTLPSKINSFLRPRLLYELVHAGPQNMVYDRFMQIRREMESDGVEVTPYAASLIVRTGALAGKWRETLLVYEVHGWPSRMLKCRCIVSFRFGSVRSLWCLSCDLTPGHCVAHSFRLAPPLFPSGHGQEGASAGCGAGVCRAAGGGERGLLAEGRGDVRCYAQGRCERAPQDTAATLPFLAGGREV